MTTKTSFTRLMLSVLAVPSICAVWQMSEAAALGLPVGPTITADPQAGPAGGQTTVQGMEFAANTCGVQLALDSAGGPSLGIADVTNGAFSTVITIPENTTSGPHKIVAQGLVIGGEFCASLSGEEASTDYRVIGGPQAVERLKIEFSSNIPDKAGEFRLISRMDVQMVLPPSDELPATKGADLPSGFWYELQSADGSVKYRRIIHNPVFIVFEGPDLSKSDMVPDRVESLPEQRVFSLLIPAPDSGDEVVLFSSPLEPDSHAQPASEVGRIPLFDPIP
ncbi:MAG: hypothetical protein J5J06_00640 [Phycisphaerae bacterium]|nr:hypothetical protein [Phycisphaerae bacterium]